ncbi:MAG TPA: cyclic nucleotide-binding domain-containing protein [Polyangiaceae bacterium]|jgi:CRP-like cAMP-binding protein|nr:cyclic nucleotide-binding domain-containing protein [Polyangiaceae bacterium]
MPADGAVAASRRVERVLALRSFPGLALVDPAHLAVMAEVAEERAFRKGEVMLTPGTPVRSMHLIRRGDVAILREGIAVRTFRGGDIVGAIAALTRAPEGQHIIALTDTTTFEIDVSDFEEVLEESFALLLAALRGTLRGALECRLQIPGDAGYSLPPLEPTRTTTELGLVERVLFLRRLNPFGAPRVEALAELAREMVEVTFRAGAQIWRLGEPSPYSLVVWSGVISAITETGQRFRFGPDSVVGGIDSIAAEPRWYIARAETDVVALRGDASLLMDVIEDHPDMGIAMLRAAAGSLTDLYARVDRLALDSRE